MKQLIKNYNHLMFFVLSLFFCSNITAQNTPPVAVDDYYYTLSNIPLTGNILTNDFDPNGNNLIVNTTSISNPFNGTHTVNPDGSFTYVNNVNFTGLDSFIYQICDDGTPVYCDTATAYINVATSFIQSVNSTDITDCGLADGTISITTTIASSNWEYSIDSGFTWQSSATFSNLSENHYNVVLRDTASSLQEFYIGNPVIITEPIQPFITNVTSTDPSSCAANDGAITVTATGASVEYSIDGGLNWQASGVFSGLSSGTYPVCMRNNNVSCSTDCGAYITSLIAPNTPIIDSTLTTNPTNCGLADGTITINTSGGSGFSEYSLDGGLTWQASNIFTGLSGGTYYSTCVRNANGTCTNCMNGGIVLTNPVLPTIDAVASVNPTTCGTSDGTITLSASGGTGTYEYSIDGGVNWITSGAFTALACGTYDIKIRNDDGTCEVSSTPITLSSNTPNQAPIAVNNTFSGIINLAINGNVSINDTEPDGDVLIYNSTLVAGPLSGFVIFNTDGSFSYIPNAGFGGVDNFTYEVCDNGVPVLCDTAVVVISYSASSGNCNLLPDTITTSSSLLCTGTAKVCLPIATNSSYSVFIDGQPYVASTNYYHDCGDTTVSYDMNSVVGSGPWLVDFKNTANNYSYFLSNISSFNDLVDTLNYHVNFTNTSWGLNPNNTISSIIPSWLGTYELIFTDISTNVTTIISPNITISSTSLQVSAAASLLTITDGSCTENVVLDFNCKPTVDSVSITHPSSCGVADGSITAYSSNGSNNKEYRIYNAQTGHSAWQTSPVFTGLLPLSRSYSVSVRNAGVVSFSYAGYQSIYLTSTDKPSLQALTYSNNTLTVNATSTTGDALEYAISANSFNIPVFQSSNLFSGYNPGNYYTYVRYVNGTCQVSALQNTNTSSINANNDVLTANYHGNYTINVLTNDTHGLGSPLVATPQTLSNANGTVTLDAAGNFSFNTNYYGIGSFSFTYQACVQNDPTQCDVATVYINIRDLTTDTLTVDVPLNGIGDITVYNTGLSSVNSNISNNNAALGCDAQINNAYIDYNSIATSSVILSNNYRYIRYFGTQLGSDTTCTVLCENNSVCDTTILIVNVVITNTAPVLSNDYFYNINTNIIPLTGNLLANDYDPEGDAMTVIPSLTSPPTQGTLVLDTTGAFTYTPNVPFSGLDSFQYIVCDYGFPYSLCDSATVYLYGGNPPANSPPVISNINSFNGTCAQNSGSINIMASSGAGSLQYSIDSGLTWQASNIFSALAAGSYNILVDDGNATTAFSANPVILTPVVAPIFTNVASTNPTDCGINDGTITVTATGMMALQYSIDGGLTWQNSNTFTGLMAGTYNVFIRNNDGTCQVASPTNSVILTATSAPIISIVNPVNPTNCTTNNGLIAITAAGNMALEYSIDGGITWQITNTFTGLPCGTYPISVRYNNGTCPINGTDVTLFGSTLAITQVFTTDATCGQNNGGLSVYASGGTNNYEYSITGTTWQTSDTFPNLTSGTYTVYVRDGIDTVTYSQPVVINNTNGPTFVSATMYNDSLFISANQNGQAIQFSIDCGTTWQNSSVFFPAPMGTICVGVQNADGSCPIFNNVTIINTPPVAVNDNINLAQSGYISFNVLNNDYDIENNLFAATPQVQYYGSDSMTLTSSGVMTIPTNALNLGSYMINYQICEIYNPTNCSQGSAYFSIVSPVDTLRKTVAIGATQTICISTTDLPGTPISAVLNCGLLSNIQIDSIVGACAYVYADNYGSDTTCVVICDNFGFCDTTIFIVTVVNGVWPGDADDDTYANNFDLLNIGLGYGLNGTTRSTITNTWNGYITPNWGQATPVSNVDYRHADCNGDGFINSNDTIAILQNYGFSYQRRGAGGVLGAAPLYVDNDTANYNLPNFSLPIILGEAANQAIDLYGGAFSIGYDTAIVEANSVRITFDTSWVGTQNINMISINKNLEDLNQIDAAFTRIDGLNVTGHGIIATLDFTIKDDILRKGFDLDSVILTLDIFNVKFISNNEQPVDVNPNSTNIILTSIENTPILEQYISVFPNPTSNSVQVMTENIEIKYITILDINGRVIHHTTGNAQNNIILDVAAYPSGIYMLQIHTSKGIATKRLTVIRE